MMRQSTMLVAGLLVLMVAPVCATPATFKCFSDGAGVGQSGDRVYAVPTTQIEDVEHGIHRKRILSTGQATLSGEADGLHIMRANYPDDVIAPPYKVTSAITHCFVPSGAELPPFLAEFSPEYTIP
jgi:hypothetical protein